MSGEIGVDREPGEGSLFWVCLPIGTDGQVDRRDGPVAAHVPELADHVAPLRTMRVRLVADGQINRLAAREMLQRSGHQVIDAQDGSDRFCLACMQPFDAILMDISMPELDGRAATRTIRDAEGPKSMTPMIALTANALPEDTLRFLSAVISDILLRPLSVKALQQTLAHAPQFGT